ncbi:MAG: RNA-binding protein [Deltaproteobacteria bacterium]|nr:RNA-binding protein [Deltaproteobacteria bacterium]
MGTKLYVGNLPFSTTEEELSQTFAAYGEVTSARIITDKFSGRSRGFGFVEMTSEEAAKQAVEKLNDTPLGDRKIVVNEARPESRDRPGGGGGGPRRGGFGGNRRHGGGESRY